MSRKKAPALRQGHGMRKHAIDVFQRRCNPDQVVPDAQLRFAHHRYVMLQKKVKVLQNRSSQAVLNRNDRAVDRSIRQRM